MNHLIQRLKELGPKKAARLLTLRLTKKISHTAYRPLWYWYKCKNLGHSYREQSGTRIDSGKSKEMHIRGILAHIPKGSFLEIGIGEFPHFERLARMQELGIAYTACDFESVCKSHQKEIALKGFDTRNMRFATNSTGTYAWTLFEMLQKGERFDVIYVDGHHTFYIDLPAIILADKLLKPGGYLLLDDISWSLAYVRSRMMQSISQWFFYRKIYDFSEYTKEQQSLCHIKMIAEEILLKDGGYTKDTALSLPDWWVLRKK